LEVTWELDGLLTCQQVELGPARPGHHALLACLTLLLDLLGHGVRRDGLELRLTEAARQPQTPLPVVGDVCPEAEIVAALRLGSVVAGGSLKIAERALGVGPV